MGKPFIKLLKSPNSYYFYDVNHNEIIEIDEDSFTFLEHCLSDPEHFISVRKPEMISSLMNAGYLRSSPVKEIMHPYTNYCSYFLNRNLQKVTIQLTQNCNFRCTYCTYSLKEGTQRNHSNKVMPLETAFKAILFLRDHSIDSKLVYIGFYGGEPLLAFNNMVKIVEFAEKQFDGKPHRYTITTNGSLLNDEVIKFFIRYNFSVVISLDGPQEINDKNRLFADSGKGTYDVVYKNIKRVSVTYQKFFHNNVTINFVIDPSSDFDTISNFLVNFVKCDKTINYIDDSFTDDKRYFAPNHLTSLKYNNFLSYLCILKILPDNKKISPISWKIALRLQDDISKFISYEKLTEIGAPSGPCIPGQMRPLITVNGDIIPCERVNETADAMIIGNVFEGFKFEKVQNLLNIGKLTEEECKTCWAYSLCTICAKCVESKGKLDIETKRKNCEECKDSIKERLLEIIMFREAKKIYHV